MPLFITMSVYCRVSQWYGSVSQHKCPGKYYLAGQIKRGLLWCGLLSLWMLHCQRPNGKGVHVVVQDLKPKRTQLATAFERDSFEHCLSFVLAHHHALKLTPAHQQARPQDLLLSLLPAAKSGH